MKYRIETTSLKCLKNEGDGGLTISQVGLGGSDKSEFAIAGNTCSKVVSKATCSISVLFAPAVGSTGNKVASLSLSSNDDAMPLLSISLTGVTGGAEEAGVHADGADVNNIKKADDVTRKLADNYSADGVVGFTATNFEGTSATISLTFDAKPANSTFFKMIGSDWMELYPKNKCKDKGVSNVSLTGNILTYTVEDDSEADSDKTPGIIEDPIAVASQTAYKLEVAAQGGGTVTSEPAGIDCGPNSTCMTEGLESGTVMTLTAVASAGYNFTGWDGCDQGSGPTCTVTLNPDKTVTAEFTATHTVTTSADAHGSLVPSGALTIIHGTTAAFAVTPDPGYAASIGGICAIGALSNGVYTTGAIIADCAVTVQFSPNTYMLTSSAGADGFISPGNTTLDFGDSQSFTATPNANCYIASVSIDGAPQTVADVNSSFTYTFVNVTAAHAISATFAITTYSVTPSAGVNGGLSPNTPQAVNHNSAVNFTISPADGYHIDSVTGCGGTLSGTTYTTGLITEDCAVTASFAADVLNTFAVTPSAGPGGSISPNTAQTVNANATAGFTITPNSGNHIETVTGCGGTLSGNIYTTAPVTANCTVAATFAADTFTVTPSAGPNGSISPNTPQTVNNNDTTNFTVTPDSGFQVEAVIGCGGTLSDNTYTTGPVTSDCAVSATFSALAAPLPDGDLDGDGKVDVADALKALRIAAGVATQIPSELSRGDVAPVVNGRPEPDGAIDIGDVVVILRKSVGLVSW